MIILNIDELEKYDPEYRETIILYCPDCPHEYEVEPGSLVKGAICTCPECNYTWIVQSTPILLADRLIARRCAKIYMDNGGADESIYEAIFNANLHINHD